MKVKDCVTYCFWRELAKLNWFKIPDRRSEVVGSSPTRVLLFTGLCYFEIHCEGTSKKKKSFWRFCKMFLSEILTKDQIVRKVLRGHQPS